MGLLAALAAEIGVRVHVSGGAELVASPDLDRVLEECSRRGVLVVGLEGFRLTATELRPDMSAIVDLSPVSDPQESVDRARSIVAVIADPGLLWDLTLVDRQTPET